MKRRQSLTFWFDLEMVWEAAPTGRPRRRRTYSVAIGGVTTDAACGAPNIGTAPEKMPTA